MPILSPPDFGGCRLLEPPPFAPMHLLVMKTGRQARRVLFRPPLVESHPSCLIYGRVLHESCLAYLTLSQRLAKQLEDLQVPFVEDFEPAMGTSDHIVDAIFGETLAFWNQPAG